VPRKSEPARELLIMPQMPLIVLFTVFFTTDILLCSGLFLIWTMKTDSVAYFLNLSHTERVGTY